MISPYPSAKALGNHRAAARGMENVMEAIRRIRSVRNEMGVKPSRRTSILLKADGSAKLPAKAGEYIVKLASGTDFRIVTEKPEGCTTIVTAFGEMYIPLGELIDYDKEIERLSGELENARGELERANARLANENFVAKAPKALVDGERAKTEKFSERIKVLENKLEELRGMKK